MKRFKHESVSIRIYFNLNIYLLFNSYKPYIILESVDIMTLPTPMEFCLKLSIFCI